MKILFVENHARFARITVQQFLAAHDVTVVPGLAAARAALAQNTFDAILVDYDLDDGKGVTLVQEIQGQRQRPLLIGVSSHKMGNVALKEAGADAICEKLQFANIEQLLLEWMARR